MPPTKLQFTYRVLAGMACLLAGVGMVRYAYAPLLPSMFHEHWLDPTSAAYVGAVNFGANLLAAMFMAALARRFTVGRVARWALVLGVLATAANAIPLGPVWIGGCRFLAGCTAAGVIILTPILCVQGIDKSLRSVVVGLIFIGAGIGVIAASLLIPLVVTDGPSGGWWMVSAVTLACTLFAWRLMRPQRTQGSTEKPRKLCPMARRGLVTLLVGYSLYAVASVPHAIFLSAYLHHDLGVPTGKAAMAYASFGIGLAVGGPLLSSLLARVAGLRLGAIVSAIIGIIGILTVLLTKDVMLVIVSGGLIGMAQNGLVPIGSNCCLAIAGPSGHAKWWSIMSVGFTLGVVVGTLAMGVLFHAGWGYLEGFKLAAGVSVLSLICLVGLKLMPLQEAEECAPC